MRKRLKTCCWRQIGQIRLSVQMSRAFAISYSTFYLSVMERVCSLDYLVLYSDLKEGFNVKKLKRSLMICFGPNKKFLL